MKQWVVIAALFTCVDCVSFTTLQQQRQEPSGPTSTGPTGPSNGSGPSGPTSPPTLTSAVPQSAPASLPHVRQGRGTLTLDVSGSVLQGATFSLANGAASLSTTVQSGSDNAATVSFTLPHGAALGLYTLTAQNAVGSAQVGAFTVTEIFASPSGDIVDSADTALVAGSDQRPFRTLSAARSAAGDGDTVRLGAGTFAVGETWPTVTINDQRVVQLASATPDWPPNVTILGTRSADTDEILTFINGGVPINGGGVIISLGPIKPSASTTGTMTVMAVLGAGDLMRDVEISQFHTGLMVTTAGVRLGPMSLYRNGYGLRVEGSGASLTAVGEGFAYEVLIDQSTLEGVWIGQGTPTLALTSGLIISNSTGLRQQAGTVTFTDTRVGDNGKAPRDLAGNNDNIFVGGGTFTARGGEIARPASTCIVAAAPITLRGVAVDLEGATDAGLVVYNGAVVDIGSDADGSNPNFIKGLPPSGGTINSYGISDQRNLGGVPIRAVDLRFTCTSFANCSNAVATHVLRTTTYVSGDAGIAAPTNMRLWYVLTGAPGIQF